VPRTRTATVVVALTALLAACAGPDPAPPPAPSAARRPDPAAARGATPAPEAAQAPWEVVLTIPAGRDAGGDPVEITVRATTAGPRRELVVDTPAGVVERHVMTDDEHWWWITPLARDVVDVEWVHLDLAEVDRVGGELPEPVADARAMLPEPGEVAVGSVLAGRQVLRVDRVGPDEERITVADLDDPVRLRRRRLPAGTEVDLPPGATPLRELPQRVGR